MLATAEMLKPIINWPAAAGVITALLATFTFMSNNYASTQDAKLEVDMRIQQDLEITESLLDLQEMIRRNEINNNLNFYKARAYPLTVRRDILMTRTDLSKNEAAELTILITKITELERESVIPIPTDDRGSSKSRRRLDSNTENMLRDIPNSSLVSTLATTKTQ